MASSRAVEGATMNKLTAICYSLIFCVSANVADAHMYGRQVPLPTSTGYNHYSYEWHADLPWNGARVYQGLTNIGPWLDYPAPTIFKLDREGIVGPVTLNRWYRTKFYHAFWLSKFAGQIFIAADICGSGPPTHEK